MNATLIWIVVISVVLFAVLLFVFDILKDEQKQNENAKETIPLTPGNTTNQPIGTGGLGTWSKVALWLIVILLGINGCQMFSMRNQTENLHKDIHKIMGIRTPSLTDCQDIKNYERLP